MDRWAPQIAAWRAAGATWEEVVRRTGMDLNRVYIAWKRHTGNHNLGGDLIWGFGLPSGTPEVCPGMSAACRAHCYAGAVECYRPAAAAQYRANLRLSRRRDFVRRVRAFLIAHEIRVVRIRTGGDFYSRGYARRWLRIVRASPRTRFFFYTRSWRVPPIRAVVDPMAKLPNCAAWYSLDCDRGMPSAIPPHVRVAWLTTNSDDVPPAGIDLVFRVRRLRRRPAPVCGVPVRPAEDGVRRVRRPTCDRCGHCWRPDPTGRVSLPVIDLTPSGSPSWQRLLFCDTTPTGSAGGAAAEQLVSTPLRNSILAPAVRRVEPRRSEDRPPGSPDNSRATATAATRGRRDLSLILFYSRPPIENAVVAFTARRRRGDPSETS